MDAQELRNLQEAYSQVYELDESAIGDRARNAVADQRLDAAQGDTQQSVDKLGKREKVTRASAHIAAKKTETTARNMHPKPGTTGAYRITDSFDLYNIILSHLLDEGYVDTQEAAEAIIVNMSEDWRKEILDEAITSKKGTAKAAEMIAARTTASGRAKPGKGANVAQIRQISRSNIEGLGGTPMTPTMARNPVKKKNYFGTGNKAARRAGTYQEEVNNWVNSLIEEGYDLSEYSWDDMYEMYVTEGDNYDKNRKRAAQRAAARNAARDAGQTGAVPGVGYVTPRRENETYRDSAGTERHKSGARMPEKKG